VIPWYTHYRFTFFFRCVIIRIVVAPCCIYDDGKKLQLCCQHKRWPPTKKLFNFQANIFIFTVCMNFWNESVVNPLVHPHTSRQTKSQRAEQKDSTMNGLEIEDCVRRTGSGWWFSTPEQSNSYRKKLWLLRPCLYKFQFNNIADAMGFFILSREIQKTTKQLNNTFCSKQTLSAL
jgi:hypothetical protein